MITLLRIVAVAGLLSLQSTDAGSQSAATGAKEPIVLHIRSMDAEIIHAVEGTASTVGVQPIARDVEIHLGAVTLVAREAEIRRTSVPDVADVVLRGDVHLKGPIEIKYRDSR